LRNALLILENRQRVALSGPDFSTGVCTFRIFICGIRARIGVRASKYVRVDIRMIWVGMLLVIAIWVVFPGENRVFLRGRDTYCPPGLPLIRPVEKNFEKGVDGRALRRIMRRSLRERCPSADSQKIDAGAQGLLISPVSPV
jgi:hypothetical protein